MALLRILILLSILMVQGIESNKCRRRSSCDECLTTRKCVWCRDESGSLDGECLRKRGNTCPADRIDKLRKKRKMAEECNYNGVYQCGQCDCNPDYSGPTCECNNDDSPCRSSAGANVCSLRGSCICGQCACDHPYTGRFCECDNYSCQYYNGALCGGPQQGRCECGQCLCNPGWAGPACECSQSTDSCIAANGLICNGKGTCRCGQCVCDLDTYYSGITCEECPTCPGRCVLLKPCVFCHVFQSGPYSQSECESCPHISIVSELGSNSPTERTCRFRDDTDGCLIRFSYALASNEVWAKDMKEDCPPPTK